MKLSSAHARERERGCRRKEKKWREEMKKKRMNERGQKMFFSGARKLSLARKRESGKTLFHACIKEREREMRKMVQ